VTRVHPTALISSGAELAEDVEVGAFAIIGDDCHVSAGCVIGPRVTLEKNVRLAGNVKIGTGSVIGGDPQDLKYRGEETWVEIGENTTVREYATVNRGTTESFRTTVGKNSFIMSYVHLAHDCHVGDGVILANGVQLAGHVTIEDRAILSGLTAVHQFVRIGSFSFIGGCSRVAKDIPPYLKAVGNPLRLYGLNTVGLERAGIGEGARKELKRAYRLFFRSELNLTQARERAEHELEQTPEVVNFLRFFMETHRGVGF
jgi:UDP-N-acetylglucosamine acyltransferase